MGGISRSNAVFDNDKLAWFNIEWIRRYSPAELLPLIEAEWTEAAFQPDRTREEDRAAIALLQPRARSLTDFAVAFRAYFSDAYAFDAAAVTKFLYDEREPRSADGTGRQVRDASEFTEAAAEKLLRGCRERRQGGYADQWIASRAHRSRCGAEPLRGDGGLGQGAGGPPPKAAHHIPKPGRYEPVVDQRFLLSLRATGRLR